MSLEDVENKLESSDGFDPVVEDGVEIKTFCLENNRKVGDVACVTFTNVQGEKKVARMVNESSGWKVVVSDERKLSIGNSESNADSNL